MIRFRRRPIIEAVTSFPNPLFTRAGTIIWHINKSQAYQLIDKEWIECEL
jgi:hypothetical protein